MKARFLIILLLLLASCGSPSDDLPEADWCYRMDFRTSDYSFTINAGSWVAGRGFVTSNEHKLNIYKDVGTSVAPNGAILLFRRSSATIAPISVQGSAIILGTWLGNSTTTIPAEINELVIRRALASSGSILSINISTSEAVQWEILEVHGMDSNPFGSDNCSGTGSGMNFDPIELPIDDIIGGIQEADQTLADADTLLTAPDGTSLIPQTSTLTQLFGYAKWIVAPTTANSLAGPFAPIIVEFGLILVAELVLLGIYMTVYIAIYFFRWLVWLIKLILEFIQAGASFLGGGVKLLFKVIGL